MKNTSLDFSRRPELGFHAEVVADVEAAAHALALEPLLVGAFARDLHLHYAHGIDIQRQTQDLDFALAVPDWSAFERLRQRLIDSRKFKATKMAHRLAHERMPIDLVPFGSVETQDRKLAWPPNGDVVMDAFGLREARDDSVNVKLPNAVATKVVSLPALALLKVVCWQDRHSRAPRKDAVDLHLIATSYLQAGNESRLWEEWVEWTQLPDFDYEIAGSRMLGVDIGQLLTAHARQRVMGILEEQSSTEGSGLLANQMSPRHPEQAFRSLAAMLQGLSSSDP